MKECVTHISMPVQDSFLKAGFVNIFSIIIQLEGQ